jgi:hypothetical protein
MTTNKHDLWFKTLVHNFPQAEVIEDVLAETRLATKPRNADYFFEGRRFIGELKSLETSRMPSIQTTIDQLRDKGELPIFYHEAPASEIIKDHLDQKTLNKKFLMEIAKRLEKDFREANSQIRDTKAAFNIPAAKGLILLTNSELRELNLKLVWNELNRLILRTRGNAFAYEHIDFAIYLQDVEVIEVTKYDAQQPVLTVLRQDDKEAKTFIDKLLRAIAQAKGFKFVGFEGDIEHILDSTIPHKRLNVSQTHLRRSDVWKKHYLKKRTYRQISDEDLLRELGRFILEDYLRFRDGKIAPDVTAPNRDQLGETLEGLFTECELRFLDMRKLQKQMYFVVDQGLVNGEVAELIRQRRAAVNRT